MMADDPTKSLSVASGTSLALTLLIASAGGALAALLSLPVAWLLGPVIAVSAASLGGVRTALPGPLKTVAFFILGIQAGSGVTPAIFDQIAIWPASFAIQMVGVGLIVVFTREILRRGFGWDRDSALFAALPGALAFVMAAAAQTRANLGQVAVVQSMRLIILIAALVPILATLQTGEAMGLGGRSNGTTEEYLLLFAVAGAGAALGHLSRVPAGLLLGALLGSAALHVTDVIETAVPPSLAIPALILLGTLIGGRLEGASFRSFVNLMPAALVSFAVALGLAGLSGLAAVWLLGLPFDKVALAYAPGALEALTVLAYQFDVDPAYVAAHHLVRFLVLIVAIPFLAKRSQREVEEPQASAGE